MGLVCMRVQGVQKLCQSSNVPRPSHLIQSLEQLAAASAGGAGLAGVFPRMFTAVELVGRRVVVGAQLAVLKVTVFDGLFGAHGRPSGGPEIVFSPPLFALFPSLGQSGLKRGRWRRRRWLFRHHFFRRRCWFFFGIVFFTDEFSSCDTKELDVVDSAP